MTTRIDIRRHLQDNHHITFNEQQRTAVETLNGPVLLLAVPGAGKTTVMVARVANLILNRGIPPSQVLTVTFNREAARDMARRWDVLFGSADFAQGLDAPSFSTIHSFCYRVLGAYARERGTQMSRLMGGKGAPSSGQVIAGLYRELTGEMLQDDALETYQNAIGYAANMMLDEQQIARLGRRIAGFAEVRKAYTDYKRQHQLMDFDDMLTFTHMVLSRYPALLQRYREQYRFLHVDEAQDTSKVQHEIIRLLYGGQLFMVGDEDQSIYGFRGAYAQMLHTFEAVYPGAQVLAMEENFRSSPQIVSAAHAFISAGSGRRDKGMVTAKAAAAEIGYHEYYTIGEMYAAVLEQLKALPAGETAAVLYRSAFSSLALVDMLEREGIPFYLRQRNQPFAKDGVVRDILDYLGFGRDMTDAELFGRIYYKLGCYISKEIISHIKAQRPKNIFEAIDALMPDEARYTARLQFVQSKLARLWAMPPVKMIDCILYDLGYFEYIRKRGETGFLLDTYARKLGIIKMIAARTNDGDAFITRLTQLDALAAGANRQGQAGAAITLSTVHSAKGLEFDHVFLVDLMDGIFPAADVIEAGATGNEEELAEEARLFYTAVTRAKTHLELFCASRMDEVHFARSRYFDQLRDNKTIGQREEEWPELQKGRRMIHFYFGMGDITWVDRRKSEFSIQFKNGGTKTFDFDALKQRDIFRML